jgi:hypothetical protein
MVLRLIALSALLLAVACTPVRMAGDAAVGAGQLALGAVDLVL